MQHARMHMTVKCTESSALEESLEIESSTSHLMREAALQFYDQPDPFHYIPAAKHFLLHSIAICVRWSHIHSLNGMTGFLDFF